MKSFAIIKKIKNIFIILILLFLCANNFACSGPLNKSSLYNGEFLEKKLAMPYNIEGILTQNGEKYDVTIECGANTVTGDKIERGEFRIKFTSGDVTEGLTVEFFDNGVFLFFDDLRFKTNSEIFTNLEALKTAFETLSAPYIEKYVTDTAPVDGIDIVEIGVQGESGDIKAYVNKLDGSIIRLTENLNGTDIVLDVKKFENMIEPLTKDNDSDEVYDYNVVDDFIYT
ncbi:MAG: hypothetical protein FWF92_08970 [Oscillospiraceae bacterium]|nr:hypothetical protein [Oscillospiraceae bacterium]